MHGRRTGFLALLLLAAMPAAAETILIEAGRDTTLVEDPEGALGNGSGPILTVGRNNQENNTRRRGLLWFDVAAALPEGAFVESARLLLQVEPSNAAPREIGLHLVLADWGEGASVAFGGSGAPAEPGDATWKHTFYDYDTWVRGGGQFVPAPSASQVVAGPGLYVWEGGPGLVRDVRLWQAAPHRNFGWLLLGDEATRQTAKTLASRETSDPSRRPLLEVTYR